LWMTEFGWRIAAEDAGSESAGEEQQLRKMRRFAALVSEKRNGWHLGPLMWYAFRDDAPETPNNPSDDYLEDRGLFRYPRPNASPETPRPSWHSYSARAAQAAPFPIPDVHSCPALP
jgi:hypothetical protein